MAIAPDLQSNPLIHPPKLPHNALPFNRVRIKHFLPAFDYALEQAKAEIDAIKNETDAPTFKNTIVEMSFGGEALNRVMSVFDRFTSSKISPALSKLEEVIPPRLSEFTNQIYQDEKLFNRVAAVYHSPEAATLGTAEKRLLKDTYDRFADNGFALDAEGRKRFTEIEQRLSVLSAKFSKNTTEATEAYKYFIDDESRLDGIPADDKKEFKANAIAAGKPDQWLIVLEPYPAVIMTHAKDRVLREEINRAYFSVAYEGEYDNHPILLEMVRLKDERAKLMKADNTASEILAKNMAKDVATVNAFLQRGLEVYKPAAEKYLQQVRDYALETDGITDLKPWDVGYYGRALKEKLFNFDAEALRPYFELGSVEQAINELARDVLNLDIKPTKRKYPVHHKDIKVSEVFNRASGEFVSLFYVNNYARPGQKRGGAWMSQPQSRTVRDGVVKTPSATNDCNYKKQEDGSPTLLYYDQTETMAHEFGHAGHGMLTRAEEPGADEYEDQAGTNVVPDWVEFPSQFMEPFMLAKARDPNDNFGRHYLTGEKIPAEMLDRMVAAREFEAGIVGLRQIFFGMLDMKWHTTDPALIKSVEELEDGVVAVASLMPRIYGSMSTSFTHLFGGGYTAGYYGYKITEVMAADSYEASQAHGKNYDRDFLDLMVKHVYQTGDRVDPAESYKKVHGRGPDPDALFRLEGLMPKHEPELGPWPFPKSPAL